MKTRAEARAETAREAAEAAHEEARVALENAFAIDPEDLTVLYSEGRERLRRYERIVRDTLDLLGPESMDLLDELLSADVDEAQGILDRRSTPPEVQSQVIENLAQVQNSLKEAAAFFDAGIEAAPESRQFYELAARVRLFSGELDEALQVIKKGLDSFGVLRGGLGLSNRKVGTRG